MRSPDMQNKKAKTTPKNKPPTKKTPKPTKVKKVELFNQFDENGSCLICNDEGFFETKGKLFECVCSELQADNQADFKTSVKEQARDIVNEVVMEEFGFSRAELKLVKENIVEHRKHETMVKDKLTELKKNAIKLPIVGADKPIYYDTSFFRKDSGYHVFIYNNDITTVEQVVGVLEEKCDIDENISQLIAKHVSEFGSTIVTVTQDVEQAEDICQSFRGVGIQAEWIKH